MDLRAFGGPVLAFAERGDVEETLVLGGNRAHTWESFGMDIRVRDNWDAIRNSGITATFKVEFGPGDLLAVTATVLGIPIAAIGLLIGAAWFGENTKSCGWYGHEYYDPTVGQWQQEKGVVFVGRDQPCPPGTFGN